MSNGLTGKAAQKLRQMACTIASYMVLNFLSICFDRFSLLLPYKPLAHFQFHYVKKHVKCHASFLFDHDKCHVNPCDAAIGYV